MAAANGRLPLLPPPPVPPPRQALTPPSSAPAPISLIAHLPPDCRPKVEPLMYLMVNIEKDECFDWYERKQLQHSPVGAELQDILRHCQADRERAMASLQLATEESSLASGNEDNSNNKINAEMNLMRLQTCILRHACPFRMKQFERCWTNVSRQMERQRHPVSVSRQTCKVHRQALERCAGSLVAQSLRQAVDDPFPQDDE